MTNKEAIKILKEHISPYDNCAADAEANEAIHLAIKALEQEECEDIVYLPDMNDSEFEDWVRSEGFFNVDLDENIEFRYARDLINSAFKKGYNNAKREIALSGEYERAFQRGYDKAKAEQEKSEDCISRAEAIRIASGYCHPANIASELGKLPRVKPKRKTGRWVPIGYDGYADGNPVIDTWECSECNDEHYGEDITLTDFCPNCGAEMEVIKKWQNMKLN